MGRSLGADAGTPHHSEDEKLRNEDCEKGHNQDSAGVQ